AVCAPRLPAALLRERCRTVLLLDSCVRLPVALISLNIAYGITEHCGRPGGSRAPAGSGRAVAGPRELRWPGNLDEERHGGFLPCRRRHRPARAEPRARPGLGRHERAVPGGRGCGGCRARGVWAGRVLGGPLGAPGGPPSRGP